MDTKRAPQTINHFSQKSPASIHLKQYDVQCIQAAHTILSKDPPPQISIEGLALEVGLNRTKLQYGFKKLYGINIYEFQVHQRMEKAKLLLINTAKPVKTVASQSGYSSVSSFVAVFKRLYGTTPLQFRKQAVDTR
jgi:AraC-like DNA-binding protein